MYPVVHRLRTTVVAPWASAATGDPVVRPPRSVLLYGPEGSGSAFIAGRLVDELASAAGVDAVVVASLDVDAASRPRELVTLLAAPPTGCVVVIGVSHAPWKLPSELTVDGGFERLAFVSPPDWDARRFRLWEAPWARSLEAADLDRLVALTERWAGTDLALLGTVGRDGDPTADELLAAAAAGATDADDWLAAARAMVPRMHAGRIDDLVGYLQRYRLL